MRYFFVIGPAIFLDGLQAGISFALAGFMGTIGGGAVGALAAQKYCPELVQGVCTTVATVAGAAAGSFANPVLIPIGIALGFVINICLSLSMGAGLIFLLVTVCGWGPVQKYLMPGFIGDMIPGINNLPFWTFLAIAASWEHAKQEGKTGILGKVAGIAVAPTRGIMNVKEKTMDIAEKAGVFRPQQQERIRQPQNTGQLISTARTRTPMQDIRPSQKPNVQPA